MKQILSNLFNQQTLERQQAQEVLLNIGSGSYNDAEIASFLTVFLMRPIAVEEVLGFQDALLELSTPFDLQERNAIDIVGTGGDGKNTFNISTLSAVVVAGAGYQVCKHGNYGVSSGCGSSNVLEELGYQFTNESDRLNQQLDEAGICFLHAPLFHPAMKRVAPVRKQLGLKTFFNLMGPLVNPARPDYQLLGVYASELGRLYQYVLQANERQFRIVHALDGYDEISLTGPAQVWSDQGNQLLYPDSFSVKTPIMPDQLAGGATVQKAAAIFRNVLENRGTEAQISVVCANAGMAIQCLQPDKDLPTCVAEARESLESGSALATFEKLLTL